MKVSARELTNGRKQVRELGREAPVFSSSQPRSRGHPVAMKLEAFIIFLDRASKFPLFLYFYSFHLSSSTLAIRWLASASSAAVMSIAMSHGWGVKIKDRKSTGGTITWDYLIRVALSLRSISLDDLAFIGCTCRRLLGASEDWRKSVRSIESGPGGH